MELSRNKIIKGLLLLTVILLVNGCSNNKYEVDVSGIESDVTIQRFDKELYAALKSKDNNGLESLKQNYSDFYFFYNAYIMDFVQVRERGFDDLLYQFIDVPETDTLFNEVFAKYDNLDWLKKDIDNFVKHYKYYFPEAEELNFITYVALFRENYAVFKNTIGIELDLYMGEDYHYYYLHPDMPQYIINKCKQEYILPNISKAVAYRYWGRETEGKRFLDYIIHEGKVMYFTDLMLPKSHDTLKIGYTQKQLEWCEDNKAQIWAHFIQEKEITSLTGNKEIEEKPLYSTDKKNFIRYINDGPFTTAPGVPSESAPMIGIWTGWQIVRDYMDNNPKVTLAELMADVDADKILKESGYKPQ